MSAETDK